MNDTHNIVVKFVVGALLIALLFAPLLGLPIGAVMSTGTSMGDSGPVLNLYVNTEPEIGDVVAFDTAENPNTQDRTSHRIVDETEQGYVT